MRELKVSVGATLCARQRFHTQAQAHVFVSESTILLERPFLTSPATAACNNEMPCNGRPPLAAPSPRRRLPLASNPSARHANYIQAGEPYGSLTSASLGLLSFPLYRLFS